MDGYRTALATGPQLILTDKEMPKLDGYGLISALKGMPETESIPVILISGALNSDEEAKVLEKGFFDFISKPVKEITLITRVKRALQYGAGVPVRLVANGHRPRK
jgi:PleD family two-component response regulator